MDRQSVFFTALIRWTTIKVWKKIRYDLDKPRIAPYENTWRPHRNTVYWCNLKARSEERIAVLSNTITRNRSLLHTACNLYWEGGMHEDQGGAIPQSISVSKVASCYTEADLAKWTTGSTWSRSKNILWPPKCIGKSLRNRSGNVDKKIPGIPHSTVQQQDTNRKETVRKLIQQFENHPNRDSLTEDSKQDWGIQSVQRKIEEVDHRHGQYGDLRALRNLFQETMQRLCFVLGNGIVLLLMWKKSKNPRRGTNRWTRRTATPYQYPVTSSKRTSPMVPNMELPNGNECTTAESSSTQAWWLQNHFWKMAQGWQIPQVFVRYWVGWGADSVVWRTCIGKTTPILQQVRKELGTWKIWVLSLNNEGVSTSWFRWSKTRIKKTAWWTCERDFRRKYTHSSCTTDTTAKKPTIWRTWRIWLSNGWRSYPSKTQENLRHPTSSSSATQWEVHWKSNKTWDSWRSSSWTEQ